MNKFKLLIDMFTIKSSSYSLLSDSSLYYPKENQPIWVYGHRLSYFDSKFRNDNLALFVNTVDEDFNLFKSSLKSIDNMTTKVIDFPY